MTQEEKLLLLKDLCARLPYGVKIQIYDDYSGMMKDEKLNVFHLDSTYSIEYRKLRPYLRPLSSMTEEEYNSVCWDRCTHAINYSTINGFNFYYIKSFTMEVLDFLNAYHFDYRKLIERGLAIAVTEENNPYEEAN